MNDRPEQWDWPEPVQDRMSDQDFAMIVQEMRREPGFEERYAQRRAKMLKLWEELRAMRETPAEPYQPDESDWPEPVQDRMSDQDFAMIVQEMRSQPGYEAARARRLAGIERYLTWLRAHPELSTGQIEEVRDDDENKP
jgi:hypothetical protein